MISTRSRFAVVQPVLLAVLSVNLAVVFPTFTVQAEEPVTAILDREMELLAGEKVNLKEKYDGKAMLIVNVASRCGLTPQYKQLQALHEKYGEQGLAVVAFPCNQFGKQEPGTASEIQDFCEKNYGVSFDLFAKIDVNGDSACELYQELTEIDLKPTGKGDISWNFEKFVVDRSGNVVARFSPRTAPDAPELIATLEKVLADK